MTTTEAARKLRWTVGDLCYEIASTLGGALDQLGDRLTDDRPPPNGYDPDIGWGRVYRFEGGEIADEWPARVVDPDEPEREGHIRIRWSPTLDAEGDGVPAPEPSFFGVVGPKTRVDLSDFADTANGEDGFEFDPDTPVTGLHMTADGVVDDSPLSAEEAHTWLQDRYERIVGDPCPVCGVHRHGMMHICPKAT